MGNRFVIGFAILLGFLAPQRSWTQTALPAKGLRSAAAAATDITNAEIQAVQQKNLSAAINDQALRVVSINGEYNVSVGIVHRTKASGRVSGGAIEHSEITEDHVLTGTGTFVTGGAIDHAESVDPKQRNREKTGRPQQAATNNAKASRSYQPIAQKSLTAVSHLVP
jgi:hypothetical protein